MAITLVSGKNTIQDVEMAKPGEPPPVPIPPVIPGESTGGSNTLMYAGAGLALAIVAFALKNKGR